VAQLRIDDFSGGKTDNYVNGPVNAAQIVDNVLIDRNRKWYVRNGSEIDDIDYYQIPAGEHRISNLYELKDQLFKFNAKNIYFIDGGWNTLTGPVDNNTAFGAGNANSHQCLAEWNSHLFMTIDEHSSPRKMFYDGSDWQVRTSGLTGIGSDPTITPDANDGKSYVYSFNRKYTYTVGSVTFVDRGPTRYVQVTGAADFSGVGHYNQVSSIPVLANGATQCWDTAAVKVEVYRTTDGGTTFYYAGEVTNGTTTFEDDVTDASLVGNALLYTTGGVYDNDPPPQAKYIAVANDIAWYANVKEGSEEIENRIYQSKQYDLDSVPGSFFIDMDEDISAINSVGIYPIVFSERKAYRLEGFVDETGRGFTKKREISDTVGCVSNDSVIKVVGGLFFCSLDGFYFTDGFRVQKLSRQLNDTYKTFVESDTQKKRIFGTLDINSERCYWSVQSSDSSTDNDTVYVLDPYWGLKHESCFTTLSGGANFAPSSLLFVGGDLYRGDDRGYTFSHGTTNYNDPVINTLTAPSTWYATAVIYDYTSTAFGFGTEVNRKWVTSIVPSFHNITNLSLSIQSSNDDSQNFTPLKEIRFRNNIVWGDEETIWGDESVIWNFNEMAIRMRRFPAGSLRCTYKQVKFTNALTNITSSDDYEDAVCDGGTNTATITNFDWSTTNRGQFFTTDEDAYSELFEIIARTDKVLTVEDAHDRFPTGPRKWIIKGYRKDERIKLEAYTIQYEVFGESHPRFTTSELGGNA